jgi:hypothetical protein
LAVEGADKTFHSDYQGFVGLAPYAADVGNMEKNFIWNLKQ